MIKDLKTRLKLRPPWKYKQKGLRFSPGAEKALSTLGWDKEEFVKEFNPQHGAYEIVHDGEVVGRFYGRYNQSGVYMIHYRKMPGADKELSETNKEKENPDD